MALAIRPAKDVEVFFAELLQVLGADGFLVEGIAGHAGEKTGIRAEGEAGVKTLVKGDVNRTQVHPPEAYPPAEGVLSPCSLSKPLPAFWQHPLLNVSSPSAL